MNAELTKMFGNDPEFLNTLLERIRIVEEHRIFVENQRRSIVDRLVEAANREPNEISMVVHKVKNFILTGATQMGKTSYIINSIKEMMVTKSLIVISCDNKIDQMNQLKNRLIIEGINPWKLKSNVSTIAKSLNRGNSVVMIILNNAAQAKKLQATVMDLQIRAEFDNYRVFHDEGDMVNKSDDIKDISNASLPESHRRWVQHFNSCQTSIKNVTRYWVSATPENCAMLYDIPAKNIIVLPRDEKYVGITKHIDWDGSHNELEMEIERLRAKNNGEVILYCTTRKNDEQKELAKSMSLNYSCIACVYNGTGIFYYIRGKMEVYDHKDIASFLSDIREESIEENLPVVIVGFELMNRGISFVSTENSPLTATVMFYKGGESYLVNLAQRFGRITGTSRPDLKERTLYCSVKDYDDYMVYSNNQKNVWDALTLEGNADKNIGEIMKDVEVVKTNRKLDRPKLVSVNSEYKECTKRIVEVTPRDMDLVKMKRLVISWKNENNDAAVARLFRAMVANGGEMASEEVREHVEDMDATYYSNLTSENHSASWGSVFRKEGRNHYIREEAMNILSGTV